MATENNSTPLETVSEPKESKFRENYLLFQFAFLSNKFSSEFYDFLRGEGVSPSQWRVLVNVMEYPGIRVTTLADKTLFEQSRVTKLVDQLCLDGLILKTTGKSDRRQVNLTLTRLGESMLRPLIDQAKHHEAQLLEQLDDGDAEQLKKILSKLTKPYL